jgi:protease-4
MSLLSERSRRFLDRLTRSWVVFVALGVVVGLLLAPVAFQVASTSTGTVAVVPISGAIDGPTAAGTTAMLAEARNDPNIEAVVLVSNSPGGGASASETMYLEVSRTAEQMPVVASVDASAASGAYYAIAPSDYVYAKPASLVGSVGVFVTTPQDPQPIDQVTASGPKKLSSGNERDWAYKTESLRRAFVGAVFESRGENLSISREELSKANIYTGAQAVRNGMVDETGGTSQAIRDAARRAGLDNYDVRVMRPTNESVFVSRTNYVASDHPNKTMVSASYFVGNLGEAPAMPNFLMMPESVLAAAIDQQAPDGRANGTANATGAEEGAP